MSEEKINQILRNQHSIMRSLFNLDDDEYSNEFLVENCIATEEFLNPPKEPSIKELTEESLGEVRNKFGTRRK